jgi:hypothetical protein
MRLRASLASRHLAGVFEIARAEEVMQGVLGE